MSTIVPVVVNWNLYKDTDFEFDGQWVHNGVPADLSGVVFDCAVYKNKQESSPMIVPTVTVLDAAQGYFRVTITDTQLSSVDADSGILVIKVTQGTKTQKLVGGFVNITR